MNLVCPVKLKASKAEDTLIRPEHNCKAIRRSWRGFLVMTGQISKEDPAP